MTLEISDIVKISAKIRPTGVIRQELGRTLFLTKDKTLHGSGAGKVEAFSNFTAVGLRFPSTSEPYKAAQVYFAQTPYPKNLIIGRWNETATSATLVGGAIASLASLQEVQNGSFTIYGAVFGNIDFSNATSYADIATILQAKIPNSIFAFSAIPSRVTLTFTIDPSDFSAGLTEGNDGTFIGDLLGLSLSSGGTYLPAAPAETISSALDAIQTIDDSFYFVCLDKTINDTVQTSEVSAWASANTVLFSAESNEASALTAQETTSRAALISVLESPRTFMTWSATADYKSVSIVARLSSVIFSQPNSLITAKFKSLPGTLPDKLSTTQKQEIDRKRLNVYTPFSTDSIYAEGWTLQPGTWIDVKYWLDWFVGAVEADVYNTLRAAPKVPQTNAGLASLVEVIDGICRQGVRNGGIARGTVSPQFAAEIRIASGDNDFDGVLSNGYLIVPGLISAQSQTERATRVSTPINIYLKGAGALHFADIGVLYEQ